MCYAIRMTTTGGATETAVTNPPDRAATGDRSAGRRRFWTRARARTAAIVLGTLAIMAALLWSGAQTAVTGTPITAEPEQVVVVGVPNLGLADLDNPALPTLRRLADDSAVGATNVRTLSTEPSVAEAYATLGAGARVAADPEMADRAYPPDTPLVGGTAADVLSRRVGEQVTGSVVIPAMPSIIAEAGEHVTIEPGALATKLRESGVDTAVVSNADRTVVEDARFISRPAAVAVADETGVVPAGTVDPDVLLVPDATAPYGHRADVDAYLDQTMSALDTAELVLVDLGDTSRASSWAPVATEEAAEAAQQRALEGIDAYLSRLVPEIDDNTRLLVVGVTPPTEDWGFTPMIVHGAGVSPGTLESPAVNRGGLVAITDIAPTILDWFGAERSAGMVGQPLQVSAGAPDLDRLAELNQHADSRGLVYYPMIVTFIALQAVVYLAAAVVLAKGGTARAASWLRVAVLTVAAWPLATFADRAIPGIEHAGMLRHASVWALAIGIALLASLSRRGPLTSLAWIAGATIVLLIADVATGANLQMASVLGYSPHAAARYTGFGNLAFAVLGACAIILVAVYVHHASRRAQAVRVAAAVLAIVVLADIWPTLGADVGGVLTLVPVFALLIYALTGRRMSWRMVLLVGVVTIAVLAGVTAVDLLRPDDDRSHLGRYAADVLGGGDFWSTIERKWAVNMRVLGSTWTWVVPITAAVMIYVLALRDGWHRLVPAGSALRAGLLALVGAGVLGWLVNDTGVVITALVFGYIGPYLMLPALREDVPAASPDAGSRERMPSVVGAPPT